MIHYLKTDPIPFDDVAAGRKTFEIRHNDRDFQVGDILVLKRTEHTGVEMQNGSPLVYTGATPKRPGIAAYRKVTHILGGGSYAIATGCVVMSIEPHLPHPALLRLSIDAQACGDYLAVGRPQQRGILLGDDNLNFLGRSSLSESLGFESTNKFQEFIGDYFGPAGFDGWLLPEDSVPPLTPPNRSVLQDWVHNLPFMQQTVLLTAIRGPDGIAKYGATKNILRWLRRCVLISALDKRVITNPYDKGGGSFTGPSISDDDKQMMFASDAARSSVSRAGGTWSGDLVWEPGMVVVADEYLAQTDGLPHHFQLHLMHAVEILGYKHPDERIRHWWLGFYNRIVHSMHLWPEDEGQLDTRLGDTRKGWLERADPATVV